jgi:hypothetical protein
MWNTRPDASAFISVFSWMQQEPASPRREMPAPKQCSFMPLAAQTVGRVSTFAEKKVTPEFAWSRDSSVDIATGYLLGVAAP